MNPIDLFKAWYKAETDTTTVRLPASCCLSTIGLDGFPNARFVALKEVMEKGFIITGSLTSRKGQEVDADNKAALTFWWTATEKQVRIQGNATRISDALADKYFAERNRDSQIVSLVSDQGQGMENPELLTRKYEEVDAAFANISLPRPGNWGGWLIDPVRIEFLAFKPTRFHERTLYELIDGQWTMKDLQP
jgi:pyridoxamine 5'-phosphate oxidase